MFSTLNKIKPHKFITNHFKYNTRFARHYSLVTTQEYAKTILFNQTLSAFQDTTSLHFDDRHKFNISPLNDKLRTLLHTYFTVNPYHDKKIKTISMRHTLELLDIDSVYSNVIKDDYYLIGIHGTSFLSLPNIIPYPSEIKNMETSHNPYHKNNQPICFFYGDNLRMSLHYSDINSICTEKITGDSDPDYYPDRVGILGFASKPLIDYINDKTVTEHDQNKSKDIIVAETIAWVRQKGGIPDECKIGNEIRIPSLYHSQISNLLVFGIKGEKRPTPLDEGIQYDNGKQCRWKKGIGYTETDC